MDCSKTINFLSEFKRLCDSREECVVNVADEENCPMFGVCSVTHSKLCAETIKKAIEIVQKWSDEHPKKTYAQDFFEKFPGAPKDEAVKEMSPLACRRVIYGGGCRMTDPKIACCYECWNEPMEE